MLRKVSIFFRSEESISRHRALTASAPATAAENGSRPRCIIILRLAFRRVKRLASARLVRREAEFRNDGDSRTAPGSKEHLVVCVIVVRSERWKAGEHPERASERAEGADFGDGKKALCQPHTNRPSSGQRLPFCYFAPFSR